MAKLKVKVDNGLDEIELVKKDDKKDLKKKKQPEEKKEKEPRSNYEKIKYELSKVTWPTKKNMVKYSIATIVLIVILALFFVGISALFDLLYGLVRGWIS